jgi:hypothetical protein
MIALLPLFRPQLLCVRCCRYPANPYALRPVMKISYPLPKHMNWCSFACEVLGMTATYIVQFLGITQLWPFLEAPGLSTDDDYIGLFLMPLKILSSIKKSYLFHCDTWWLVCSCRELAYFSLRHMMIGMLLAWTSIAVADLYLCTLNSISFLKISFVTFS